MFTREDIEKLKKYEKYFKMVDGGYIRGTSRAERAEIKSIYDKTYPEDNYHYSDGCSACVLSLFKRVKKAYEKDKRVYEEADKIQEIVQEELEPTTIEATTIKKRKNKATKTETNGN